MKEYTENNLIIYKDSEENIVVDAIYENETLWLSQKGMAKVFDVNVPAISKHLKKIFEEGELNPNVVVSKMENTTVHGAQSGKFQTQEINIYSLDAIIAVGYRINSKKATQFRIWSNKVLKDYMIKGFSLNTKVLKNNGSSPYFDELLSIIRDIRSSEKAFWRKVLDIYATSIDYDPNDSMSIKFFKTVQNKMHYATHGNTAAELIFSRVDSSKKNIGLTNFNGKIPTRSETEIAKNYLTEEELNILNRMVSSYLEVAELNALSQNYMTMKDWIEELDNFIKLTRKDILTNSGCISHEVALKKAHKEYDKYMAKNLTTAEKDFIEVLNKDISKLEN